MQQITLKGKSESISKEETRAWVNASLAVLSYHNLFPATEGITYIWKKKLVEDGKSYHGFAYRERGLVELYAKMTPQEAFTTILHETIHLVADFGKGKDEACVSTLVSRLKPDVAKIAAVLLDGTYRRAAAFAHTKISYGPKNGADDFYNQEQHTHVPWKERYRRKKGLSKQRA